MFKFLKEKLKTWVKTVEEPEETKKVQKKKSAKKISKKKEKFEKKFSVEKREKKTSEKEIISEDESPKDEKKSRFNFFKKKITPEKFEKLFEELNLILLQNNIAFSVVDQIKSSLEEELLDKNQADVNINDALRNAIKKILINPPNFIGEIKKTLQTKKPFVIIFLGINGAGKTTSIGKIATLLKKEKLSCCFAAADTFRAASIEQLQTHADNLKIQLIKKDYGSDPASVGFDAVQYAGKNKIDVVLIDTAGRMNTKESLMREIEKIVRVNNADMKIFVGESITGNDATEQAKAFNDSVDLSGIILSKADVDEKGGTAISVSHVTKKPILFLGTGQEYKDLEIFDKEKILKSLGL